VNPGLVITVLGAGAVGALARYGISLAFIRSTLLPRAVLLVNVLGSLLGGAMLALAERAVVDGGLRLILVTGIAGGLTTFSTWSVETMEFVLSGRWRTAVVNLTVNVVLGLGAATAAYFVVYLVLELHRYRP
jgi:CrcB protein